MSDGDPLSTIIFIIVLLFIQTVCTLGIVTSESLSDSRLKRIRESEAGEPKALKTLSGIPARIRTSAFRSGYYLSAAVAAVIWYRALQPALSNLFGGTTLSGILSAILSVLLSVTILHSASDACQRIYSEKGDGAIVGFSGILLLICRVFQPLGTVCSALSTLIVKLAGSDPSFEDADITEDEIKLMIDEGSEDGAIDTSEQEMIHNILEFDDLSVAEIMTHRTEVNEVYLDSSYEEIVKLASESGHSRLPVCGEDLDDVKGVLMVKDLLLFALDPDREFSVKDVMRDVLFLPETALADEALEQLRRERIQLAIVVDEYGGTAGIVTMEDLIETIVGNIQDEYDNEPEAFTKISDTEYVFDGAALLDDISESIGLDFEDADDSYDTIAGYVIDKLHRIPVPDEEAVVETDEAVFTVTGIEEHRITEIRAVLKPKDTEESEKE